MIGFLFLRTRVLGIPIPFHRNFEEVNLRFYVRRKAEDGWRRGVVFVKEILPRAAIALVARKFYNEPYIAFVNRGRIGTEGSLIWANYFENSGLFNAGLNFGSISLESQIAGLTNGSFSALQGNISITTGDLIVTNHALLAGRLLTLSATHLLTDTGARDANT